MLLVFVVLSTFSFFFFGRFVADDFIGGRSEHGTIVNPVNTHVPRSDAPHVTTDHVATDHVTIDHCTAETRI